MVQGSDITLAIKVLEFRYITSALNHRVPALDLILRVYSKYILIYDNKNEFDHHFILRHNSFT